MKCCSVFSVPVWLSEALGMRGEIAQISEKGSICSIWQLSVKTQLMPPLLWWGVSCYVDLEQAEPSSERGGELPAASPRQLEKRSSVCPTSKLSGHFPSSLKAIFGP